MDLFIPQMGLGHPVLLQLLVKPCSRKGGKERGTVDQSLLGTSGMKWQVRTEMTYSLKCCPILFYPYSLTQKNGYLKNTCFLQCVGYGPGMVGFGGVYESANY